jgi:hypothetical protein
MEIEDSASDDSAERAARLSSDHRSEEQKDENDLEILKKIDKSGISDLEDLTLIEEPSSTEKDKSPCKVGVQNVEEPLE